MKKVYIIFFWQNSYKGVSFVITSKRKALKQMQILRKEINASKYFIGYDKPYDKTHVVEFEGENYMDGFRVIFDEKSSDHDIVFYLKEFDVNSFYKMNFERKNK